MVEIDYIFDADACWHRCQEQDVLVDQSLLDWEMLMRLRMGDVEVLGYTEEEYQRWMNDLKRFDLSLQVPSSAWSLVSVLSIAISIEGAFRQLRESDHADIDSLDFVMRLDKRGDLVLAHIRRDRIGQALYREMYPAFAGFAERVRNDFLTVCPRLRDHLTLGPWFRGEANAVSVEEPSQVIYLPPASPYLDND